jgi:protein involved in polysaccharide export with SLBB domain
LNERTARTQARLKRLGSAALVTAAVSVTLAGTLPGGRAGAVTVNQATAAKPCPAPAAPAPPSSASATPSPSPIPLASVRGSLHPGDKITVTVFDHPELSGDATVTNDFAIVVPLAGYVDVRKMDIRGVAHAIEDKLTWVISPSVDVKLVSQSNTVFLAGNATGTIALKPGDRLATALGEAKIASTGDLTRVGIIRDGVLSTPWNVRDLRAENDPGPALMSGDVITVPSKPVIVRVSGAVKAPAVAYLGPDEPLGDALSQVQTTDDADVGFIRLTRGGSVCYTALSGSVLAAGGQTGDELMIGRPAHVTVGGSVAKAGTVTLKGDRSLVAALALAGGPSKEGNLRDVIVMRAADAANAAGAADPANPPKVPTGKPYDLTALANGDPSQNPDLSEGDAVFVTQAKTHVDPRAIFAAILLAAKKYVKLPK